MTILLFPVGPTYLIAQILMSQRKDYQSRENKLLFRLYFIKDIVKSYYLILLLLPASLRIVLIVFNYLFIRLKE